MQSKELFWLYKIGEVSRINYISQRMLRYYDEKALLKPVTNGYRYYTNDDIAIANISRLMK